MSSLVISCLSQKGGVGKSTMARLIAYAYAKNDWQVKIADFNTTQNTSVDWVAIRKSEMLEPVIDAEQYNQPSFLKRENYDLIVSDGRPDSDQSSLAIAEVSTLIIVPTGLTLDDLKPQIAFAMELVNKGIDKNRIIVTLNKTSESVNAVREAREYIEKTGFKIAENELSYKVGYQMAQNTGRSVAESGFKSLNDRAEALGSEIIGIVNELVSKENV